MNINEPIKKTITKPIVLVGIMGCGKTFFGKKLATHFDLQMFDLDSLIKQKTQYSTKEIFYTFGQRKLEQTENEILAKLFENHKVFILSTNDNIINNAAAWQFLKNNSLIIWLNIELKTIATRLKPNQNRPLLQEENLDILKQLQKLYHKRKKRYYEAHLVLKKPYLTKEFVIENIEKLNQEIKE